MRLYRRPILIPLRSALAMAAICFAALLASLAAGDSLHSFDHAGFAKASSSPHAPRSPFTGQGREVTLGKLCQATEIADIHTHPDPKSEVCYEVKAHEFMVSKPFNANWTKILLQDGEYGYSLTSHLVFLPYTVTHSNSPAQRGSGAVGSPEIAGFALGLVGLPVSTGLRNGGFVHRAFEVGGIELPFSLKKQSEIGKPVTRLEDLQPGDRLYFWDGRKDRLGFGGIYLGGGHFIGPLPNKRKIETDYLGSKKWLKCLVAARR